MEWEKAVYLEMGAKTFVALQHGSFWLELVLSMIRVISQWV